VRLSRDRGAASIELALITPVLLLVVLLLVQGALAYHARNALQAAAQEGARAARAEGGTATEGEQRALAYLSSVAPRLVEAPAATVSRTSQSARVTVTGRVVAVVPFLKLRIEATSDAPVERFRAP
jgi:Flp pilus assembly protein TadG